jgi:hypothetical protein
MICKLQAAGVVGGGAPHHHRSTYHIHEPVLAACERAGKHADSRAGLSIDLGVIFYSLEGCICYVDGNGGCTLICRQEMDLVGDRAYSPGPSGALVPVSQLRLNRWD